MSETAYADEATDASGFGDEEGFDDGSGFNEAGFGDETADETTVDHAQEQTWPAMRVALHVGAFVLNVLLFAGLVFELRGGTSVLAWGLAAAIAVVALAQVVLFVLSRRTSQETVGETEAWAEAAPVEQDDWQAEPSGGWQEADAGDTETDDWQEAATPDDGAHASTDAYTVGCPSCGTAFTITDEMAARGEIHCINCGVGGQIGAEELDRDNVHKVTCQECDDVYDAHSETSTCPSCGTQNEEILA